MAAFRRVSINSGFSSARTTRKGDILGYARVSTADQDVAPQEDRLRQAGAIHVFVDVISGRQFERPRRPSCIAPWRSPSRYLPSSVPLSLPCLTSHDKHLNFESASLLTESALATGTLSI